MLNLPENFEFECPLCGAEGYEVAPFLAGTALTEKPIYKCTGCHLHFSDPASYPKPVVGRASLKGSRRTQ